MWMGWAEKVSERERDKGVQTICTCGIVKRTLLNGIYELSK